MTALAGVGLIALTYFVFKGFNWETRSIYFSTEAGKLGRYRFPLILVTTACVCLLGVCGAGLGYGSLGERRNKRPALSWIGLLLGGLFTTLAVLLLAAWRILSSVVIT